MGHSPDHPITGSPDGLITGSPDGPMARSPDSPLLPRLYAIIDPAQSGGRSPFEVAAALLAAGVRLIQLRDKQASSRDLYATAQQLAAYIWEQGGTFIVNDRADVALAVGADGVHLGQDDLPVESARAILGPGKMIGYSTHVLEQVREADRTSANYIAFGPVFPTTSKMNPDAVVGLEGLRAARKATRKPLVAIGGITLENARAVIEAGADSVAIIRGLLEARDVRAQAEDFLRSIKDQVSRIKEEV
jgi:thiamine-phosphate pyrophosphorylase